MLVAKLNTLKVLLKKVQVTFQRNIQVSVIGAASDVGSNLALLLKQNNKISRLQLYDNNETVNALGLDLGCLPGGPFVSTFAGACMLLPSLRFSDLVVMVDRVHRKPGYTREQMIFCNAPMVQRLCRALAEMNSNAFLAIGTSPLNSIVPFASTLLHKYGTYDPFKVFGVTHLDLARGRALTASALQVDSSEIHVPIIGGHSDETIVPLFSNITPSNCSVDERQADFLTRLLRKAGTEVINKKMGSDSATLSVAWSINEFVDCILDALRGAEVTVNAFTANPHFGTKYFSGPTVVGPNGILQPCYEFTLSNYENKLLNRALPMINRDVSQGEEYVDVFESFSKKI
ncbi:unnamed protein product, partial [Iphiclides podalirius]